MDPFQRLPAELIHKIIEHTADFASVESLLSASPKANSVFHAQPGAIMRCLVASNPMIATPEVRMLFRGITIVRRPEFHCASLDNYISLTEISPHVGDAELSQMLHIAARIQRLACICLSTMQTNFVSAVDSPLPDSSLSGSFRAQKEGEPFCWIEECRVYWALWHLQLYSDLCKAAEGQASSSDSKEKATWGHWGWTAESIERLDAYAVWNEIPTYLVEAIWAVAAVLADLGLNPSYQRSKGPQQEPSEPAWNSPDEEQMPFFPSFELPQHTGNRPVWWYPPPIPDETAVTRAWRRSPDSLNSPSAQTFMFRALCRHFITNGTVRHHPLAGETQQFRRLGVLLWDKWRMYSVGLFPNTSRERVPTPDGGFVEGNVNRPTVDQLRERWWMLVDKKPSYLD